MKLEVYLIGNVIYIWDANLAIHDDIIKLLEISDAKKFVVSDNELISADDISEEQFLEKRMIRRMMGLKINPQ